MSRCLGRHPARHDPRTLRFARYAMLDRLPAPPPARDWSLPVGDAWRMFQNDQLGCCTVAAAAHMLATWAANVGKPADMTDGNVIAAYSMVSGYRPGDPSTDRGANMLDVLKHWRNVGIGNGQRHRIAAFAKVERDSLQVKIAANLFGGLYVGAQLPIAAQKQAIWTVPAVLDHDHKPNSWGGHAMHVVGYDRTYVRLVTWGREQLATWQWFTTYCDEIWAVVSNEWIDDDKRSPNGFAMAELEADLARLG